MPSTTQANRTSSLGDPTGETNAIASETVSSLQNREDTWGPPFSAPSIQQPAGKRQTGHRNKNARDGIFEFSLFNKKAPIKQVNTGRDPRNKPKKCFKIKTGRCLHILYLYIYILYIYLYNGTKWLGYGHGWREKAGLWRSPWEASGRGGRRGHKKRALGPLWPEPSPWSRAG